MADDTAHRDSIAMVFQNFALYPHMTVFQNIAFPLQAPARRARRDRAASQRERRQGGTHGRSQTLSARTVGRRTATRRARARAGA